MSGERADDATASEAQAEHGGREAEERSADPSEFEEGRYLYCVVDATRGDADEFAASGLDDERAYVVSDGGIGAVVHAADSTYDAEDPTQVRKWLLDHQRVVDEAGEAFGTPLPFRFHTILPGDDDAIEAWLDDERDHLGSELGRLADHWEYRISIRLDEERLEKQLTAVDEELRSLRARKEDAGAGTAHLLQKQYEQQLRRRKRSRREELLEALRGQIGPHVVEAEVLGGREATLEGVDADEPDQRVTALVHESEVDALGDALDEVASEPGVEIRFTGPWPPYTFAAAQSDGNGDGDRERDRDREDGEPSRRGGR